MLILDLVQFLIFRYTRHDHVCMSFGAVLLCYQMWNLGQSNVLAIPVSDRKSGPIVIKDHLLLVLDITGAVQWTVY